MPRGLSRQLLFMRGEGAVVDPVDREDAAESTRAVRAVIMPMSFSSVAFSLMNAYSSTRICGLRLSISKNFFGFHSPNHAMRTMRKPSAPMLDTLSAMYRSIP